jgi:putative transposase
MLRVDVGGLVYHVINRANARAQIFNSKKDYQFFETVLNEAKERTNMRILAYCIMPNHWHFVLYPKANGDLQAFIGWLTMTHTRRWHVARGSIGSGHLYQGRYKSFLVETNEYFLQLCRYVERNPLRAKLVKKAEEWQWSSIWRREKGNMQDKDLLAPWPEDMPKDYLGYVNMREPDEELNDIRYSVNKGRPYGKAEWVARMIKKFDLGPTLRGSGRPQKNRS